ncbi:MAG: SPOR domain-containing protein [Proteobacteria bacterium]|nr:SPOR domain-containing protein [Pseudomonadota bacterium]
MQLAPAPTFAASGPYVAQLAALQSEAAVQPAWARLSSRAPDLFGQAHLDVQRADLGARGVYFRVRAGYFANRANASRFCERIRQMGQDCIPVVR